LPSKFAVVFWQWPGHPYVIPFPAGKSVSSGRCTACTNFSVQPGAGRTGPFIKKNSQKKSIPTGLGLGF